MKKLLLGFASVLIVLMGLPVAAALVVVLNLNAAAACDPSQQPDAITPSAHGALTRLRLSPGRWRLSAEQAGNAAVIAGVARDLGVSRYGVEVALATALQESGLVNVTGGDRDSAGLFQQRPSQGWGTYTEVTDPARATQAFFGRATHTDNPGLLDISGWEHLPVAEAAQAVQRSAFPDAYAGWQAAAHRLSAVLTDDASQATTGEPSLGNCGGGTSGPVTIATLNLLGAGHTDGRAGGGHDASGYPPWRQRLPGELAAITAAGATIAGLQEVHPPQARALTGRLAQQWGIYPDTGPAQNRVIWDRAMWMLAEARLVRLPYFGGREVGTPLVMLAGLPGTTAASQQVWVWSVHNPASTRGNASQIRARALRRELATVAPIIDSGTPAVIVGDFNDARDGPSSSHCLFTPTLTNAFGGSSAPCRPPRDDARLDHIYGANLAWATARTDTTTRTQRLSDHPLVVATTAPTGGCGAAELASSATTCGEVSFPVPADLIGTDARNWGDSGGLWSTWHTGTDFAVPCGTPVYAANSGTVEIDTTQAWAGPRLVKVATGPVALATWYAHLEAVSVARGQHVRAGQQIGLSGRAGNASGCHLHFEVHLRNGPIYGPDNVDPSAWLAEHAQPTPSP